MAFSIAIYEDDPRYFTLNSFDFCFGLYDKTKAYWFEKQKKTQIHKAKGVEKTGGRYEAKRNA